MNDKIKRVFKHPLICASHKFPFFERFLSEYTRTYGEDFEKDICLRKSVLLNTKKEEKIIFLCACDGKLGFALSNRNYKNISYFDNNRTRIEKIKTCNHSVNYINDIYINENGDLIICNDILNSLNDDEKGEYIDYLLKSFPKIIFCGHYSLENMAALGPEPIGSFGCRQYSMVNVDKILSVKAKIIDRTILDDWYLYLISK